MIRLDINAMMTAGRRYWRGAAIKAIERNTAMVFPEWPLGKLEL